MQPEVMVQHFALPDVRTVTPVGHGLLHAADEAKEDIL
jgi:hypothetical protein